MSATRERDKVVFKTPSRKDPVPAQAEQVILGEKTPHLAWKATLSTQNPSAEWAVWVDVQSGLVLQRRELSMQSD